MKVNPQSDAAKLWDILDEIDTLDDMHLSDKDFRKMAVKETHKRHEILRGDEGGLHLYDGRETEVVCLCGSTRFKDEFEQINRELTLESKIVLAPSVFGHAGDKCTEEQKEQLDELHLRKIDLSDSVMVVNVNGYIGKSTRKEVEYAKKTCKKVVYYVDKPPTVEEEGFVTVSTFEYCKALQDSLLERAASSIVYDSWDTDFRVKHLTDILNLKWVKGNKVDPTVLTEAECDELGFKVWNDDNPMRLIPMWLWPFLADEFHCTSILGEECYSKADMDDDSRFGCLAYGILPQKDRVEDAK